MANEKGTKMTMMTMQEREIQMYGMSVADIRTQYMESMTARLSGLEMEVAGILSDCQEMLGMGAGPRSVEYCRQHMNIAKFILFEMLDAKESV